jgi:hypothetical protein
MRTGFAIFSRRRLLRGSLTAGGFLLMGGAGLWALRGRAPQVDKLRCLTDHEYRTLAALTRALFPHGGAFAMGAEDAGLERAFDTFLADEPEWNRADLKRALFLLEYGPVIFDRRLRTFSNLSEEERLAHFQSWSESRTLVRRQAALAFRKFLTLVFYDQPGAWPALGYGGPIVGAKQ